MADVKIPVNVEASEAEARRIEKEARSWTGPQLVGLGVVSFGLALALLLFLSECQLTPLP